MKIGCKRQGFEPIKIILFLIFSYLIYFTIPYGPLATKKSTYLELMGPIRSILL